MTTDTRTSVTVTEPLKDHLLAIKQHRDLDSIDEVIQSLLTTAMGGQTYVPDANTMDDPGVMKVQPETLAWLKARKEASEFRSYDDYLRHLSGATSRSVEQGEQPVDWQPLE